MPDPKTPKAAKPDGAAASKPATAVPAVPGGSTDPGAGVPPTTDPAGVTDQAHKPDGAGRDGTAGVPEGINANIIDSGTGTLGRPAKPEADPDDPGINASVIS